MFMLVPSSCPQVCSFIFFALWSMWWVVHWWCIGSALAKVPRTNVELHSVLGATERGAPCCLAGSRLCAAPSLFFFFFFFRVSPLQAITLQLCLLVTLLEMDPIHCPEGQNEGGLCFVCRLPPKKQRGMGLSLFHSFLCIDCTQTNHRAPCAPRKSNKNENNVPEGTASLTKTFGKKKDKNSNKGSKINYSDSKLQVSIRLSTPLTQTREREGVCGVWVGGLSSARSKKTRKRR